MLFLTLAVTVIVVVIFQVSSSRADGCKCLWQGVYLDGDDLFLRALLLGSNVSSSRLGEDMPRLENYRERAHALALTHPLFVSRQKHVCMYHWMPCTSMSEVPCDRS